MDTPTQALLGAVVGQAFFSRTLGGRALVWGAVGGVIPDLDFLHTAVAGPWGEFRYHRWVTHSRWFGPVVGSALGWGVWKAYAGRERRLRCGSVHGGGAERSPGDPSALRAWMGLFVLSLFTHPLLDLFTSYGTQLLAPFHDGRFALHAVAIVDPAYSLILLAALLVWVCVPRVGRGPTGVRAARLALLLSSAYLVYGFSLNLEAERRVQAQLRDEGIVEARVRCYPTLLQPYLRRAVVRWDDRVRVGTISMWAPGPVAWAGGRTQGDHPCVGAVLREPEGRLFSWFADGEIAATARPAEGGVRVEIDDIRYGLGGPPERGLWGIGASCDGEGQLLGEIRRYRRPPPEAPGELLRDLLRATFSPAPAA